ncbi:MAG: polysaccharide deacetylase family protein [Clostridia bacterium]|nr:polysaccharide deacetylase family protein [Clostridia bacterium]MBP3652269.1 polysaccharide deacetylase family protein [Clostridia bacterium]
MSQNSGNGTHRTLTADQKRRILEKRRRQKLKKRLMIIVPIAVIVLAALIVLLVNVGKDIKEEKLAREAAILQATIEANKTPTPAPTPTATPVPEHFNYDEAYVAAARGEQDGPIITPDFAKVDPAKMDRWPEVKEGFIPVLYKAKTTENIIAVTVDDCFQADNLRQIVQCALDNNADLTIFPIGKNLEIDAIANVVKWAYESGMEIENHTYNHAGMYHYDDERMMNELWYQNAKVSEVLGVNHQMHFFRPKGGDERDDQRVHAYVNQMGYNAIAMWTQSGSTDSMESLYNNLAPGRIYLFHTTNNDLNKLLQFIPGAIARGYRLVTLNEMFGLPDNESKDISTVGERPDLNGFKVAPARLKKTSYIRAAAVVQKRLIELGWLEGEADGVFGNSSFIATGFFQMASGIKATGVADTATQKALFADDAARGTPEKIAEFKAKLGK